MSRHPAACGYKKKIYDPGFLSVFTMASAFYVCYKSGVVIFGASGRCLVSHVDTLMDLFNMKPNLFPSREIAAKPGVGNAISRCYSRAFLISLLGYEYGPGGRKWQTFFNDVLWTVLPMPWSPKFFDPSGEGRGCNIDADLCSAVVVVCCNSFGALLLLLCYNSRLDVEEILLLLFINFDAWSIYKWLSSERCGYLVWIGPLPKMTPFLARRAAMQRRCPQSASTKLIAIRSLGARFGLPDWNPSIFAAECI
ncbi:hypothetical protein Nepgr_018736 [Nepenthes gracilis]|uniref:Uncharacterized protein n=1 Tax=Nepenthes gracilis TaxID=150966 RepID=A0AAD3SS14_NEPGR|nr:hypothetical protein Nepgr_018736 [Nepenthes gracilis]